MSGNLYLGGRKMDRGTFTDRAKRMASIFASYGVGEDDAVAILMHNDICYMEIIEACRYVGASYVTLNTHNSVPETLYILEDSKSKILVGHHSLTAKFLEKPLDGCTILSTAPPSEIYEAFNLEPNNTNTHLDLEVLMKTTKPIETPPLPYRGVFAYTSGSTGQPKGITRKVPKDTADAYDIYAMYAQQLLGLSAGDKFYITAPFYHSAPTAISIFCMASKHTDLYIAPKFDAEQFLADIERYKITHCYIVPTLMIRLLKLPKSVRNAYDVSSLRYAISTGSAWPHAIKMDMIDWFGPIFYEAYGASEIGFMTLISSPEAIKKPGSAGKPMPNTEIKILDDDHQELPCGEAGEIYVHLPTTGDFAYTNDVGDKTHNRFGKFASVGDVGYLDSDGYLFISDRKKDMIISGGANIFPAEIEAALISMPQILDCAVFGAPHPEFGETIVVAVQARSDTNLTLEDIRSYLKPKISSFKIPKKLDLHTELPREDSGKIFKQRLRAPYWESSGRKI